MEEGGQLAMDDNNNEGISLTVVGVRRQELVLDPSCLEFPRIHIVFYKQGAGSWPRLPPVI
jgi:hypothetical protein